MRGNKVEELKLAIADLDADQRSELLRWLKELVPRKGVGRPPGSASVRDEAAVQSRRAAAQVKKRINYNYYWRGQLRVPSKIKDQYIDEALTQYPEAVEASVRRHLGRNDVIENDKQVKKALPKSRA